MKDWFVYVEQAQKGDRGAFDVLVRQFGDMAVGYAYSILGDFQLAEDAAQESFIEAYFGLSKLREPLAFPAWFRKVVFKYCDRYTRKKKVKTVHIDTISELPSSPSTPYEEIQKNELHNSVIAAIDLLPEHEKSVITLVYISERTLAEVGEFLDVPVSTVKSRLYSARQRLKDRMAGLVKDTLKQHSVGDSMTKRISRILDGIERIHWRTTSGLCFTGSTLACMHYMGEDVDNDYLMGISGGAFKLFWHPKWSPANCDLLLYGEEPVRRTFYSLGYEYTYISDRDKANPVHSKEYYQDLIVKSIDNGRPVIAVGIVGPPECCVVAGYDRNGEVLYGRSYFQENPFGGDNYEQEPAGYFRTDDWYGNFFGCIITGEKTAKPDDKEVMRSSLEWAIKLTREPYFDSPGFLESCVNKEEDAPGYVKGSDKLNASTHISGLAAYDAIIEALARDEDYPAGNPEVLSFRCMALGNDGLCLLTCKRHSAGQFLQKMAEKNLPASDLFLKAGEIYNRESQMVMENLNLMPGWNSSPEDLAKIADPEIRRKLSSVVKAAKELEEEAISLLEEAYKSYS